MDLILLASLLGTMYRWLSITYDIACQYSKKFSNRIQRYPQEYQAFNMFIEFLRFFIPKFHMMAHGLAELELNVSRVHGLSMAGNMLTVARLGAAS